MNIGPFSLPVKVVIFFASVFIAICVGKRTEKAGSSVDAQIFNAILVGLVIGRIVFVFRYLPSYGGGFVKMIDFRDLGFDAVSSLTAAVIYIFVCLVRRKDIRRALIFASLTGLMVWGGGCLAVSQTREAPSLPDVALSNTNGGRQLLRAQVGRPRVVNLWATWCVPCQDEMPVLASAQAHEPDIDFVFVNQAESVETIRRFMSKLGVSVTNSLLDPGLSVAKALQVEGYPTTLFYDASGQLQDIHVGRLSSATLDAETINLMARKNQSRPLAANKGDTFSFLGKSSHGRQ
jgi:thiol-disulfide isomerase/thioredoxin